MTTFDENGAYITQVLAGRTIEHATREGLDLVLHTTCGHSIVLASDITYNVQLKKVNVTVMLPKVDMLGSTNDLKP